MKENYSKYQHGVSDSDIALLDDQNVFHKIIFSSDDKILVAFPEYPNVSHHLGLLFRNGNKPYKYLIDLTNIKYHEDLISILIHHNFGKSKIVQLNFFNVIQEVITQYYIDVKKNTYIYAEASKNSSLYSCSIYVSTNDSTPPINVCLLDEDKLTESFVRRISKKTEKDRLNFSETNYIYLMKNEETKLFKIGFSKSPTYREGTLQSKEPNVVLHKKWIASQKYESMLKKQFKAKRCRGEWFALDQSDLNEIDRIMSRFYISKEDAFKGVINRFMESSFNKSKLL
jgi:hypothetical protein